MRHAALLDEEDDLAAVRRNGGAAAGPSSARAAAVDDGEDAGFGAASDEEEYVPVKQRRLNEQQGRYRRLGLSSTALGAPLARDAAEAREAPPVRVPRPCRRVRQRLSACARPQDAKASLLVRAAELKRERPEEDENVKRAREEQEILNSITVREAGAQTLRFALGLATDFFGAAGQASAHVCQRVGQGHRVLAGHGDGLEAAEPHARLECRAV
jgi:hypothetical protein